MSAKEDPAMKAYRLGVTAGFLILEKPENWKRKLAGNFRAAKKAGVKFEDLLK